ncbi:MAG TPA: hypothetical protein VIS48_04590 [Candidatus Kryptonia bacterium]
MGLQIANNSARVSVNGTWLHAKRDMLGLEQNPQTIHNGTPSTEEPERGAPHMMWNLSECSIGFIFDSSMRETSSGADFFVLSDPFEFPIIEAKLIEN